ncbi:unnamed protein product [Triticum turgidum subsp. durum]|uniref:F-box domain-containing protein n=1 Tax=Triticum turgidum subsp. durum TaxID=4567 RepID=A0A9R0R300_TRITD|nr:unnamed protein product [Triticum turgidum subsp. durum]
METLPDDVVLEILVRMPDAPHLFRCAATCKRWWFLVAQPSFLLGFFAEEYRSPDRRSYKIRYVPSFIPAPSSPFRPRSPIASFADAGDLRELPLASRRGFLLVHLVAGHHLRDAYKEFNLAVSDPLSGTSRVLPTLKCDRLFRIKGCAILTTADHCFKEQQQQQQPVLSTCSAFSKVLIIGFDNDNQQYSISMFSSDESSWSAPENCFDPSEHSIQLAPLQFNAVVCQGAAHWLFRDNSNFYTLDASVETGHATLTKLSVTPGRLGRNFRDVPRLSVTNGVLSLLALHKKCLSVQIWTCRGGTRSGDCTREWRHTKMIKLERPEQNHTKILVHYMWAGERSGVLLIKASPYFKRRSGHSASSTASSSGE